MEIINTYGDVLFSDGEQLEECRNWNYNYPFIYKVGEFVSPEERFDGRQTIECTSGIHFFITRREAVEWSG